MRNQETTEKGGEKASRTCPHCHSRRIWKDGLRRTIEGFTQRYICRDCGYRFSESSVLSTENSHTRRRQVCAVLTEAKNLTEVEPLKDGLAGATANVKGRIIEYVWWMRKQGYSKATIKLHNSALRTLTTRGANLCDSESVKEVIANQTWSDARRSNVINAYTLFLKKNGLHWEKPKCKVTQKIPFIPTEQELDSLIAGSGKKTSMFLQLLKETAMRAGEGRRLE